MSVTVAFFDHDDAAGVTLHIGEIIGCGELTLDPEGEPLYRRSDSGTWVLIVFHALKTPLSRSRYTHNRQVGRGVRDFAVGYMERPALAQYSSLSRRLYSFPVG